MRNDQSTMLRWPDGLRQAVVDAAQRNRRSMNSEILARLEASFGKAPDPRGRAGLELTHGHLLPCPCGQGRPDAGWFGSGSQAVHHVQCPCGNGVTADTEDGATLKWNELVRGRGIAA